MSEKNFAIMEAARNEAVDQYFKARPQLTVEPEWLNAYQKLFEAGFTRGWDKCKTDQAKREPLSETVLTELISDYGCRTNDWKDHIEFARAIEAAHSIGVNHE